ncbi:hydroxysteroid 11-beta-dehydrogenase 1-like protein isoform X2 [Biomphalaria glabrata]|nr:hydroxysteroid 11-beta-dehydrogenase 1-like protein isoform X2 [Biomphalaria glabrata]XP_055872858.1 hydroxysteroid 11-beta-dehydrogenase 1-like protein isoform X2 [Biomphalaria glabrata]XP_055872859.1 hydroxysteroid 11-beta-dehydrogenase 1-like protein isoform X2 [Biomphalaria glabrata]XP_055872860.1 hydroxysteroid 11-beta-dehydrogenase 1-like protein isoform X2 [Biomphalaria glabrata]
MWGKVLAVLALGLALFFALSYRDEDRLDTLKGKRVLVTGASTGIGEQLAYQYARLGAKLAITARRKDVLIKVRDRCQEISPNNQSHFIIQADMGNLNDTKSVIETATSLLGGLDILVLNHIASQSIVPFLGTAENLTKFDNVIDVNFRSYVYLTSYAMPQILANKGSIVVINSLLGRVPHPFISTYSAAKHALHGFYESLRMEFRALKQDISITMCTLGYIATENAIKQIQTSEFVNFDQIAPVSPVDTALAIVQAGANRKNDLYYPFWSTWVVSLLRNLFPGMADKVIVEMVSV